MRKSFVIPLAVLIGVATSSVSLQAQMGAVGARDRAAQGRDATDRLKALARSNKITFLEYYKRYHQIDMSYFDPPAAIIELNLYNIMLAKMVEDKKISMEEFDYYSNKKIAETAKALTLNQN
ncbi:hypothetical protein [Methylobacterium gossipiicola]|uniref:hypothetical protein n=1 Tax=Methylobacterium gossipiicola TaxID=582675 RepID=UPI001160D458|nr:hypothetical protein [Methylobacterium gossipiicola]